jgi:putative ABC transport system permease protein
MLKNYLKIAIRNIAKNKTYSIINITGLAIGLACCILISLYIYQELSYDSFFNSADRIYRVSTVTKSPEGFEKSAQTSMPIGPALASGYQEIQNWTRIYFEDNILIKYQDNKFLEDNLVFADSTFFKVFSFKIISGNTETMLDAPLKIVLTKSMAEKYFGINNPIGKTLLLGNKKDFVVTGIIEDIPVNCHFHFGFVASYSSLTPEFMGWDPSNQWGAYFGNYTYILTSQSFDPETFEVKTKKVLDSHHETTPGVSSWLVYQPLKSLHLISEFSTTPEPTNSMKNLFIVAVIGLFILIIACINFINITTAISAQRLKEICVRKTLGANKSSLAAQFISESLMFSGLSLLLAIFIVNFMLPFFSYLIGGKIEIGLLDHSTLLLGITVTTGVIGVMSGFYPALILSRMNITSSVKGKNNKNGRRDHTLLRKTLIVVQFAISIILIVSAVIINDQVKFAKTAYLGFNKNNLIEISVPDAKVIPHFNAFKSEVNNVPGVAGTSKCYAAPVSQHNANTDIYPNGRGQQGMFSINFNFVDSDFITLFDLHLLAGRNFDTDCPDNDSLSMIINETAMRKLGFSNPQDAIGHKYSIGINRWQPEIIGVISDFHFSSFHEQILPFALMNTTDFQRRLTVKISSVDVSKALSGIKTVWEKFSKAYPFQYGFVNETIDNLYKRDIKEENIVFVFSLIAIFTACLGLFGLAAFSAEQRTKEIGIRKILGATTTGIFGLLSKEFLTLALLANFMAVPIAWYLMDGWLNDFAYRISISVFPFIFTVIVTMSITILTVSYQTIKAAVANPVESLRYE